MMIASLENVPKNLENLWEKENRCVRISIETHSINSVIGITTTLWMCLIIEKMYDEIPRECSQKLRKFVGKGKPENVNIY